MSVKKRREETAIVLSGGGARGAYEVGVVAGIVEVLRGENMIRESPFSIFTGNPQLELSTQTYLASNADVMGHAYFCVSGPMEKALHRLAS